MRRLGAGASERALSDCSRAYRLLAYVSMLVVVIGSWTGCAAPEASPTLPPLGSPVPTPTRAPTLIPVATETPVPPVIVELEDKVNEAGILTEAVEVTSGDGVAVLYLAKGTGVLDPSGRPPVSITVTVRRSEARSYEHYLLSEWTYEFSPGEARLDPPARLTISYKPPLSEAYVDEYTPQIGYFDEAGLTWAWLDATADLDIHCITADVDHLGSFIVSFEIWYPPPVS